ncbi:MAG: hypothetical protein LBF16_12675 [Pseudomonadales bacterium]|jgi:hypothetical protein|nr:hypothetical protein [Pseudomonadales bacterium]
MRELIRFKFTPVALATALAIGHLDAAYAEDDTAVQRTRQWHVTLSRSTWMDTSLPAFPKNVVTGNIRLENAYFWSGGVSRVLIPHFDIPVLGHLLPGNSLEVEGQVVKHFGKQDHVEATGALVIRSGDVHPFEPLSINVAWANGFSYAFSHPAYEMGPQGESGINSRKFQYHMGFETEFTHSHLPSTHFIIKLHHRSGIYGLISPRKTGSNYIGAGLRWDIQ